MLNSFQGDKRFLSIQIGPLTSPEHETLLQSVIGSGDLDPNFVRRLFEATEGESSFHQRIGAVLIDSGKIVQTDTGEWNLSGEAALTSEALPPRSSKPLKSGLSVAGRLARNPFHRFNHGKDLRSSRSGGFDRRKGC